MNSRQVKRLRRTRFHGTEVRRRNRAGIMSWCAFCDCGSEAKKLFSYRKTSWRSYRFEKDTRMLTRENMDGLYVLVVTPFDHAFRFDAEGDGENRRQTDQQGGQE